MLANAGGELVNRQWWECEAGLLSIERYAIDGDLSHRAVAVSALRWEERENGVVGLLPAQPRIARWLLPLRHAASSFRFVRLAAHRFAASYRARGVGESFGAKCP